MRFEGRRTLPAPPLVVWETLLDPLVLRDCIPGCREVRRDGADYHVRATIRMLFLRGSYQGRIRLVNPVPPHSFQLDAETALGVLSAVIRLSGDTATTLVYHCDGHLEGVLLRFGEPLIRSLANRLLDQYFACLASSLRRRTALQEP
ncbi:MAG: SRPBCC domain-containing protein [Chloroflexota bacterium]|nr:SRPBCC domain-containing protein [Dehalococcoidia bacterium]MDW8254792.1 SRPBCC domain-containing protein [Chloroflexota bacterium]